jgi:hypothetical protein
MRCPFIQPTAPSPRRTTVDAATILWLLLLLLLLLPLSPPLQGRSPADCDGEGSDAEVSKRLRRWLLRPV